MTILDGLKLGIGIIGAVWIVCCVVFCLAAILDWMATPKDVE